MQSGIVSRRIIKVVSSAEDNTPGEHNPEWTCKFEPPPPVVSKRLPNMMHVDLSATPYAKIGHGCFKECESLVSVRLPEGLKSIGIQAFALCSRLETVELPTTLTTIDGEAFFRCTSLGPSVLLPSSVNTVYGSAYYDCSSLESVTLSKNMERLYDFTFCGCTSLVDVTFAAPSKIQSIDSFAFMCTSTRSLMSIEFPVSVTSLGKNIFENSGLSSIRLPNHVHLDDQTLDCRDATIEWYGPDP